ncbi:hypothetical protein BD309DRAFT_483903 [Dichomitus squalens]|nr:hypothetical protein BD309DRAFT_483903 [Dichomitus squalens]
MWSWSWLAIASCYARGSCDHPHAHERCASLMLLAPFTITLCGRGALFGLSHKDFKAVVLTGPMASLFYSDNGLMSIIASRLLTVECSHHRGLYHRTRFDRLLRSHQTSQAHSLYDAFTGDISGSKHCRKHCAVTCLSASSAIPMPSMV